MNLHSRLESRLETREFFVLAVFAFGDLTTGLVFSTGDLSSSCCYLCQMFDMSWDISKAGADLGLPFFLHVTSGFRIPHSQNHSVN